VVEVQPLVREGAGERGQLDRPCLPLPHTNDSYVIVTVTPSSTAVPCAKSGAPVPTPAVSQNVPYDSACVKARVPSASGPLKMYLSVLPSPATSWATQTPVNGSRAALAAAASDTATSPSATLALTVHAAAS
jgi:hypothetical protein